MRWSRHATFGSANAETSCFTLPWAVTGARVAGYCNSIRRYEMIAFLLYVVLGALALWLLVRDEDWGE